MPNLLLGLAIAKTSSFTEIANCRATVNPQTNSLHARSQTVFSLFKFSKLCMPSNSFSEKSNILQGHKLVAKKLFCKNIYLLLAFEFLWFDFEIIVIRKESNANFTPD
jgi:hypothetical protein